MVRACDPSPGWRQANPGGSLAGQPSLLGRVHVNEISCLKTKAKVGICGMTTCVFLWPLCACSDTPTRREYTQGPGVSSTAGVPLNAILYSPRASDTQRCLVPWVASLRGCVLLPSSTEKARSFQPLYPLAGFAPARHGRVA